MILLALLAQIGPAPAAAAPPLPLSPELSARPQRNQTAETRPADLASCTKDAVADPLATLERATAWRQRAEGTGRADAGQCLGVALSTLGRWQGAMLAFLEARDALAGTEPGRRARLGAMAASAALADGNADAALAALDTAAGEAASAADRVLAGEIALDRARALVALERPAEAEQALATARASLPASAQAWLLSATLSRRLGKLADAQAQIQTAADLLPTAPDIGLEAGVIAVLSGREEAARKSWQSVIDAAPASAAARTAAGYLAQIGQPAKAGS